MSDVWWDVAYEVTLQGTCSVLAPTADAAERLVQDGSFERAPGTEEQVDWSVLAPAKRDRG